MDYEILHDGGVYFPFKVSENPKHPDALEMRLDEYNASGKKGFLISYNQGDPQDGICLELIYDSERLIGFNVIENVRSVSFLIRQAIAGTKCSCDGEEAPKDAPRWVQLKKDETGLMKGSRWFKANELLVLFR